MRRVLKIDKGWYLTWRNFQSPAEEDLLLGKPDITKGWLKVTVPGDVHLDLISAGEIPNPYYGLNADLCRWVEDKDWFYRCDFKAPVTPGKEKVFLVLEGVDTFATFYLNGREIGRNNNMFTPVRIEVTGLIKPGQKNNLAVRVASPIFSIKIEDPRLHDGFLPRLYSRKAQFNYGWDIAPHLISIGIWQPVYLEIVDEVVISDFFIRTVSCDTKSAEMDARISLEPCRKDFQGEVRLEVFSPEGKRLKDISKNYSHKSGFSIPFTLSPVHLWYPNGKGTPYLYQGRLTLLSGGRIIDRKEMGFGVRKIELIQAEVTGGGTSFYFKVNGQKTFIKGINWTPADVFPGGIKPERYRRLLEMVKETGANMVRVWGGGIYEPEIFYRLCSEMGIMVWQDFMFACAAYPSGPEFYQEIEREAEFVVKRLRKHACLALWSGGNENDWAYLWTGRKGERHEIGWNLLRKICQGLDSSTPYIPDSPFDPSGKEPNTPSGGDAHLWAHGKSYRDGFYLKDKSKFVSEIGHLSVPDKGTLLSFIPKDKLWPPFNEYWYYHSSDTNRSGNRYRIKSLFDSIKNNGLPEPKNLEEFIKSTQELQAKACETWVKYYFKQPLCGGIILWNVCDCWPQISDALINHNLKPKKAYHAVKKVFTKIPAGL